MYCKLEKESCQGPNWTSSARCWNKKNSSASEPNNFCPDNNSRFLPKFYLADNLADGNGLYSLISKNKAKFENQCSSNCRIDGSPETLA